MKHPVKTDPKCPACKGFGIRLIAADPRQRPDAPSERRQEIEMCDSPISGTSRPSGGIFRTMGVYGPTLAFQLCSCLHLETTDGPVTLPRPFELVQRMGPLLTLPAALHKAELEQAAALLICFCAENGDSWGDVEPKVLADFLRAKMKLPEWNPLLGNPFFRPDFAGLIEKGHATQRGDTGPISLTHECIALCARSVGLTCELEGAAS